MSLNFPEPLAVQPASASAATNHKPSWPEAYPHNAGRPPHQHTKPRSPLETPIATAHYVLGVILRSQRHWYIGRVWPPSCLLSRCFAAIVFLGGWAPARHWLPAAAGGGRTGGLARNFTSNNPYTTPTPPQPLPPPAGVLPGRLYPCGQNSHDNQVSGLNAENHVTKPNLRQCIHR